MRHRVQRSQRFIRKSPRFGFVVLGLSLFLLANFARAGIDYWDPQGTSGPTPFLGSMSGTWENNDWSTSNAGVASPTSWIEGDAAAFAINTGFGTPAFTVTMNANHSIAGVFDGSLSPKASQVTINGTGQWQLAGAGAFSVVNTSDGATAKVVIAVPIVDGSYASATTGQVVAEGNGQLYLNGANTYSGGNFNSVAGGTLLGYASSGVSVPWSGTVNFSNNQSFGTGNIALLNGSGTLAAENAGINIHNNLDFSQATSGAPQLNITGASQASGGTAFSGHVNLAGKAVTLVSGGTGNLVNLSGPISGAGSLTKLGSSVLEISALATYTGTTTVGNGKLLLGVANAIGSSSSVILGGGNLDLGDFSHAMGSTTLGLTSSSSINFSGSANSISFANSSSLNWGTHVLNLADWSGDGYTGTQLRFDSSSGGLNAAQLADIEFDGNASTLGEAGIDANGFITEAPEPSSIVVGLLGGLGLMWTIRRRKA